MQQKLVFGRDRDPGVTEELVERTKSGTPKTNPMLAFAGAGPEGKTCASCLHLFRVGGVAGRYYKCELRRVTGGPATDHRVRWPACSRYEEEA
jgi:hypothetical protein